tara:strand:- start:297 stop:713 length:417 start_codon:yes stop_codon:yes gene_type:complete
VASDNVGTDPTRGPDAAAVTGKPASGNDPSWGWVRVTSAGDAASPESDKSSSSLCRSTAPSSTLRKTPANVRAPSDGRAPTATVRKPVSDAGERSSVGCREFVAGIADIGPLSHGVTISSKIAETGYCFFTGFGSSLA